MMTSRVCRGSFFKISRIAKPGVPCDSAAQLLRNWRGLLAAGGSCRAQSSATSRVQEWQRKQKAAARSALSCCPHIRSSTSESLRSYLSMAQNVREDPSGKGLAAQEDPFDTITDNIPEKPVTAAEGASYVVVIAAGLAVAGAAGYAVFKELVFQPREYKVFGKALDRVKNDVKVTSRLGAPITGYGDESTNRAARQRVRHKVYKDEDGVEHIQVQFLVRGPGGAGTVHCEMFYDDVKKDWRFTYLIVDVTSPLPAKRIMLESYIPT